NGHSALVTALAVPRCHEVARRMLVLGQEVEEQMLKISSVKGKMKGEEHQVLAHPRLLDVNVGGGSFGSALHLAVLTFDVFCVQKLLALHADPNCRDADANTPLHILMSIFSRGEVDFDEVRQMTQAGRAQQRKMFMQMDMEGAQLRSQVGGGTGLPGEGVDAKNKITDGISTAVNKGRIILRRATPGIEEQGTQSQRTETNEGGSSTRRALTTSSRVQGTQSPVVFQQ
ncbi:unnamed protein product, partial [Amoebophrya sp. A25]